MRPLALFLLLPLTAAAQGTADDYKRAAGLRDRFAGTVPFLRLDPTWHADGRLSYPAGKQFTLVDPKTGQRETVVADKLPKKAEPPPPPRRGRRGAAGTSPDGSTVAFARDFNLWLRDAKTEKETRLTTDGTKADGYDGRVFWSPDSKRLVAMRTKGGGDRQLTLVESSPKDQLQPKVSNRLYLKAGDPVPQPKPHLFDAAAGKEIPLSDALFPNPWDISYERWSADGRRFYFVYNQRGHQVVRLLAADADTGAVTAVVKEECKTFFDYAHKLDVRYLDATDEVLWMSERSGWNHLYRVNRKTGEATAVTSGEWVVRAVEHLDVEKRQVTVRAMGVYPDQDPYHVHYLRVNLDGTGLTKLTDADGTHEANWSPDRSHFVDTYSRVDAAPVHELRRADGTKVCTLEASNLDGITRAGWRAPERFVAKGRDGTTDIHGVIVRPTNFDPKKTYRVIESIYAGPQGFFAPKRFSPVLGEMALAELGFIVVKLDGMGTNWRSKAFHDVCWKNLGDSGFPDRIAWIKAAAKKYPELDITNGVGIYGGSAGGQSTVRGMTEYPDFYRVGVADCGCHDNRLDKVWWNELWMGWPVGPHYAAQSNVTNAHKLMGKLLLVVGELDTNVDPASTLRVVDALIKADRDFELLLVPGAGHGAAESSYGRRRRMDFFVRHLLGAEPRR